MLLPLLATLPVAGKCRVLLMCPQATSDSSSSIIRPAMLKRSYHFLEEKGHTGLSDMIYVLIIDLCVLELNCVWDETT